jgi:selenocysteine lyase/cysteine desulfurase
LDAAALAVTADMGRVFKDPEAAPDFACVSFYKIFGFPDLGGLVVRKESGHILALRKYFGGGTVSIVSTIGGAWHLSKGLESGAGHRGEGLHAGALHEGLEDGTLPFHSILALGEAIDVHAELYGSMDNISVHTTALARRLYIGMRGLRHGNGRPLCKIYENENGATAFGDARRQGATVAFNVLRADGTYESYATVERLANERGVYVRSGGKTPFLCLRRKGAPFAELTGEHRGLLPGRCIHCPEVRTLASTTGSVSWPSLRYVSRGQSAIAQLSDN